MSGRPSWNYAKTPQIVFEGDELALLKALIRDACETGRIRRLAPPAMCNFNLSLLYRKLNLGDDYHEEWLEIAKERGGATK